MFRIVTVNKDTSFFYLNKSSRYSRVYDNLVIEYCVFNIDIVISRRNNEAIPMNYFTTSLLELLIGSNQGIASSLRSGFTIITVRNIEGREKNVMLSANYFANRVL